MAAHGDQVAIEHHVVCIIDVLGQKEALQEWSALPKQGESPKFVQALKRSIGTVMAFRRAFADFFAQFEVSHIPPSTLSQLPADAQQIFRRNSECVLKWQQFSDTFVFYAPLRNASGDVSPTALYRMLSACAMAMLFSLAGKVAIRGGICVGLGMELTAGSFYGPALAVAHHLESEIAQSPRIVVSQEIVEFTRLKTGFSQEPKLDQVMTAIANTCGELIALDEDGRAIIDFLGYHIRDLAGEGAQVWAQIPALREFVDQEVARFRAQDNPKLLLRYTRLQKYIESRISTWERPANEQKR
jgi:hypothetical protein